jgi:hypothetical protein
MIELHEYFFVLIVLFAGIMGWWGGYIFHILRSQSQEKLI